MNKVTYCVTLILVLAGAIAFGQEEEPEPLDSVVGGRGISAAGEFTFVQVVGQPLAGRSSDGDGVTVYSGSWGQIHIVHNPDAPTLQSANLSGQSLILYWLAAAEGFVLEQSADLNQWTPVTAEAVDTGDYLMVTEPIENGAKKFYRLRRDYQ